MVLFGSILLSHSNAKVVSFLTYKLNAVGLSLIKKLYNFDAW